jgi:tetratricopeptide (TPR) repeat protein
LTLAWLAPAILIAQTPERLFEQAADHFSAGRFEQAERLLRKAAAQRPKWFEARFLLGAALIGLRNSAAAVEQLEAARRLNPGHVDCAKLLAAEYLALDRANDALAFLRPMAASKAADEEIFLLTIEALYAGNHPGEALAAAEAALKRFPQSPRILAWRGFALREQNDLAGARQSLEAALRRDPADAISRGLLADVARREGRLDDALAGFEQVLLEWPRDEEALVGKARTLAGLGKLREGLEALQKAVEMAPQLARLRLELSQFYLKSGDADKAAQQAAEYRRLRAASSAAPIPAGLRSRQDK